MVLAWDLTQWDTMVNASRSLVRRGSDQDEVHAAQILC